MVITLICGQSWIFQVISTRSYPGCNNFGYTVKWGLDVSSSRGERKKIPHQISKGVRFFK
ncbi:hypothetical protein [Candidatus Curculioniphilus buchneri]|uniref:hypothetical protein n=1 Tax=Candidatus Curculioniphilus buchneri TaxID=690594 RepID=UPI00376F1D3F